MLPRLGHRAMYRFDPIKQGLASFAALTLCLIGSPTPLVAQFDGRFAPAEQCSLCHSYLFKPASATDSDRPVFPPRGRGPRWARQAEASDGESIAPFALWQASMMAHSAQDPYWRAKVRFETAENPKFQRNIEDRCLSCHAPMQQYERRVAAATLGLDEIDSSGSEGVSCTLCHQITAERLGQPESFSAGFVIRDDGRIYGPHPNPFFMPMRMHTGFTPTEGPHTLDAALCGTCHTVITPTIDEHGEIIGEFLEQAPYLEWSLSSYPRQGVTCQSCHMPQLRDDQGQPLAQYIAHRPPGGPFPPTSPRKPFGQHFFVGGNVQMLSMLQQFLPPEAQTLRGSIEQTRKSLRGALTLEVAASLQSTTLLTRVKLINRTGHKLPTAYPSRRLWLHLTVRGPAGQTVFESGSYDPQTGEIQGVGEPGFSAYEPHHAIITNPGQVAIYEAELGDAAGRPTVALLRAGQFLKDNRILPQGFDLSSQLPPGIDPAALASPGTAGDPDFLPGSDTVEFRVNVGQANGPFQVFVEVLYQTIKPSHLAGMQASRSADEAAFLQLFRDPLHRVPFLIARRQIQLARLSHHVARRSA